MSGSGFDKLLSKNVPHILEAIFLSLDYESFKKCCEVNKAWNKLLTAESFQRKFHDDILNDERKLHHAAGMYGNTNEVGRLLHSGLVDINCVRRAWKTTPLCEAAMHGHKDVVELLLDAGAEPNKANIYGETPLFRATGYGHNEVIEALLTKGADPNRQNNNGITPLHWAVDCGYIDVLKLLLESGADPNKQDRAMRTPLHMAVDSGHKEMVKLLLDKGAEPNNGSLTPTVDSWAMPM